MKPLKLLTLAVAMLALAIFALPATEAYSYNAPYYGYHAPFYASGYHYQSYSYGWSGWDYNKVYYKYHYPYSTYRYGGYYPGYYNNPGWVRYYNYRVVPAHTSFPWPGYYW